MCNNNIMDPYPVLACGFTDACMMEVALVEYIQSAGTIYGYGGDTLISIGALIIIFAFVGCIALMVLGGVCACCCPKDPTSDVYTLDTSLMSEQDTTTTTPRKTGSGSKKFTVGDD